MAAKKRSTTDKAPKAKRARKVLGKPTSRAVDTKVIVERAMPGWTLVNRSAMKDAGDASSSAQADAVSPALGVIQAKAVGKGVAKVVVLDAIAKKVATFVKVKPSMAADADASQEKVVVVRDGKVVAKQG